MNKISVFCVLLGVLPMAGQTVTLTQTRSVNGPMEVSGEPVGNWSGGSLVLVSDASSAAPVFRAFDRNGQQIGELTFTLPGSSLINIYSGVFARGFDGSFAISGSAYTADSRGTVFLAWVSADGKKQTVIGTSPFVADAVTMAHDGTIWVAGFEHEKMHGGDYDVIRRFDRSGKLIGSMIPRSSLPVMDHKRFAEPAVYSYLASSQDRVGWYSEAAGIYIAFALNGTELERVPVKVNAGMGVYNLAQCDDGAAFVGARVYGGPNRAPAWGILAIDPAAKKTTFLPWSKRPGIFYGCDRDSVVAGTGPGVLAWLRPVTK